MNQQPRWDPPLWVLDSLMSGEEAAGTQPGRVAWPSLVDVRRGGPTGTRPLHRLLPPLPAETASSERQRELSIRGFSALTTDGYSSLVGGTFSVMMQTVTELRIHL